MNENIYIVPGPDEGAEYFKNSNHPDHLYRYDTTENSVEKYWHVWRVDGPVPQPMGHIRAQSILLDAFVTTVAGATPQRVRSLAEGLSWITD